ncbi:hypothetical protein CVIRNUC_007578 [Coccomyxa viridis]|uniref:Uncharacterized protein n=1 Tax=Coccomyxa viridis TaxID=1274662 RepID=A0AAV1IBD1_9CHLO|nr:hypothetical protein CVIRNUC_007578 [Coccomyxa viridis]
MLREALDAGRRSEIDVAYQEGAEYLQTMGIESKGEVARILDIAMNPNSLFLTLRDKKRAVNTNARQLSVEQDMKPVVESLQKHGLSQRDICKVITDHPPVLCYSAEERIYPFFEFLKSVGISPEKVAKRPTLLGLEVNKSLRRIVDYLQEVEGKSIDEVAQLLETI